MANKEALRELQQRLAERMQAVRSEPQGQSWLAVDCAGQGVLFPLQQAGEIFVAQGLVDVPHAQPWLVGVANLRGGLFTVVDLAGFLGLRARRAAGRAAEPGHVVAFNAALGLNCALLVDRLQGLRHAADFAAADVDEPTGPSFAGARRVDAGGRVWQEIVLSELATHEAFLAIAG